MARFSEASKAVFIDTLRTTCNVTVAAQTAGVSSGTVYKARKDDPIFAEQWDEALSEGIDLIEHKVSQRAFEGVTEDVYHQGVVVGQQRKYSDQLAMFMLKAHRPEKYRERTQVENTGGFKLEVVTGVPATPVDDML